MTAAGESAPLPERKEYEDLPVLKPIDLPEGCGFPRGYESSQKAKELFIETIVDALEDPGWLLCPRYTDAYRRREAEGRPRLQYMSPKDADFLLELVRKDREELREIAEKINDHTLNFPGDAQSGRDVIVRALELMVERYPDLMMFRGADFDPLYGYHGIDVAPGDLNTALNYAKRSYAGERPRPVIVAIPFKAVVEEYLHHRMWIGTEGDWWRCALELAIPQDRRREVAKIWRAPESEEDVKVIRRVYDERAIRL